jgi:uncharacterized protein
MKCFFVSDLHGHIGRYKKLFNLVLKNPPDLLFFGGDLLPHRLRRVENYDDFALDYLFPELRELKAKLGDKYPQIFLILGNDDPRSEEEKFTEESNNHLLFYANQRVWSQNGMLVFGYSFVPPTPFQLKDWEKYDVSRYADPGCIHPTEGFRTMVPDYDVEYATILQDIENLTNGHDMSNAVLIFHSPPYKSNLDRAGLDGQMIDHVPLDVHVGSIAIQKFIAEKQPRITLHGHIHESTRLTGSWKEKTGNTWSYNAAHDGPELSVVQFDTRKPGEAVRVLL